MDFEKLNAAARFLPTTKIETWKDEFAVFLPESVSKLLSNKQQYEDLEKAIKEGSVNLIVIGGRYNEMHIRACIIQACIMGNV